MKQYGFTLMELIVVILLISIISLVAVSRFDGKDDYIAFTARDQAVSVIRQVQLGRMQSNIDNDEYFELVARDNCLGAKAFCKSGSSLKAEDFSNVIEVDGINFTNGNIQFDDLGNPDLVNSSLCNSTGCKIVVQGNAVNLGICINSQGRVFTDGC